MSPTTSGGVDVGSFFLFTLFKIASCVLTASIYILNGFMWILIFCYNCVIFVFVYLVIPIVFILKL